MPEKPPKSKNKREDGTNSPETPENKVPDLELWQSYCADISPLPKEKPVLPPVTSGEEVLLRKRRRIGYIKVEDQLSHNLLTVTPLPSSQKTIHRSSFQVDKRLKSKFEAGDLKIDGQIDLHGLSEAIAHRQFSQFIAAHILSGSRCLLVITGKGRDPLTGKSCGILQKSLPRWIDAASFSPQILSVKSAPRHLGGTGAFLILLRRKKS